MMANEKQSVTLLQYPTAMFLSGPVGPLVTDEMGAFGRAPCMRCTLRLHVYAFLYTLERMSRKYQYGLRKPRNCYYLGGVPQKAPHGAI